MSALETQLEDKTSAFSSYVARIDQLQRELDATSKQLAATKVWCSIKLCKACTCIDI